MLFESMLGAVRRPRTKPAEFRLRDAAINDCANVADLARLVRPARDAMQLGEAVRSLDSDPMRNGRPMAWVVELLESQALAGVLLAIEAEGFTVATELLTHPKWRGHGVGTSLLSTFLVGAERSKRDAYVIVRHNDVGGLKWLCDNGLTPWLRNGRPVIHDSWFPESDGIVLAAHKVRIAG